MVDMRHSPRKMGLLRTPALPPLGGDVSMFELLAGVSRIPISLWATLFVTNSGRHRSLAVAARPSAPSAGLSRPAGPVRRDDRGR
jgi:hypothetical protein